MSLLAYEYWLIAMIICHLILAIMGIYHVKNKMAGPWQQQILARIIHLLGGVCGAAYLYLVVTGPGWQPHLMGTIFAALASQGILLSLLAFRDHVIIRLSPLFFDYGVTLLILAMLLDFNGNARLEFNLQLSLSVTIHILASLAGYGLIALAGLATLASLLQRAKLKGRIGGFKGLSSLPSLFDAIDLQQKTLLWGAVLLGGSILSGIVIRYQAEGILWQSDHKSLLSLIGFALASGLAILGHIRGPFGQGLAQAGLICFLLITLAWPGVKFVGDILLTR